MNMNDKPRLTTLCYLERDGKYLILHRTKKAHDEKISTGEATAKRSLDIMGTCEFLFKSYQAYEGTLFLEN